MKLRIPADQVQAPGSFLLPDIFRHKPKLLGGKPPPQTGGNIQRLAGRFDNQGTGAAEGVAGHAVTFYPGAVHNPRRQGFLDGSGVGVGPPATLMKAGAAGVQQDAYPVFEDGKLKLAEGILFREPIDAVVLL